jgi:DNA modification methylase
MKLVKINEVKPNPKNPRIIKDGKFQKLVKSIQEFPDMLNKRPLVVFTDVDNKYVVLGGNMRLKACKEIGLKEIPIIVADEWTEEQKNEFLIKDNVGFGEWDWDSLANEWDTEKLDDWGLDLPVDLSVQEELEAEEDDFDVPEGGIETDIVLGDLFEIGEHRLLCGDSTCSDTVAKLMNGEKADMVFTDPPYNVNYGANNSQNTGGWSNRDRGIENDNMSGIEFSDFIRSAFANILTSCDGVIYCFGAQGKDGRLMFTVLDEMFHNSGTIIWVKDSLVLGRSKYHNKYEPCWFGWNKSGATFTEDRTLTNVWECNRPKKSDLHPTMKPIELIEIALNHNPKAKSVMDIFLGSGSTMVASHQLKRKCYGMELDPKYCQVIVDRMKKLDPSLVIKRNGETVK